MDEGVNFEKHNELQDFKGSVYGPYVQSMRKEIYHSVVAELLATGRAYPCFMTAEELEKIREEQKANGIQPGIYGHWARDRDLTADEVIAKLNSGAVPVIRLYSTGNPDNKIFCKDVVRGSIAFPENNEDTVLVKSSDGLPTYHFAHLVDDHFMRTTHVVRGEEWLSSFPLHIQLFNMMGWVPPAYVHTSTIDKIDDETGKQRKLSKRKDPEANVALFLEQGWPVEAVKEYLFNIMASGYEEEKAKKPETNIDNYELRLKKIPTSGALFDWKKLEWWAREFIATMDTKDILENIKLWANKYDSKWFERIVFAGDKYLYGILDIERDPPLLRDGAASDPKRIRKDFVTWKQTLEEVGYFFDSEFEKIAAPSLTARNDTLSEFLSSFDIKDAKDLWWGKIVAIAARMGVKNGDVAMSLRVALTGRTNTPDLYSIMQVMGDERVRARIKKLL
jgi:glutamyl-tRNA synthetase